MTAARTRKPKPTDAELELASVQHALYTDETRPHLCKPFGGVWRGAGYVGATDEHRLVVVRSANWRDHVRADAPPWAHLLEDAAAAPRVGSLNARALEDEPRCFPKSWDVALTFGKGEVSQSRAQLWITVRKGSGKKERQVHPLGKVLSVDWGEGSRLENLRHELSIALPYLLDAVDFCGTGLVHVSHAGKDSGAIVFLPYGAKRVEDADRVALVMPRKQ